MSKREIYDAILNPKQERLFTVGTVYTVDPFAVILDGDTTAIPCQSLTGLLDLREGARVVMLRYGKQYVAVGVIGEPAKSMIPLSRLFFSFDTTLYSNLACNSFDYTRSSEAYDSSGKEIPADTPIYVDFAAGKKGSLMEEGTTNLLPANKANCEVAPDVTASATVTVDTSRKLVGSGSLKVQWDGLGRYAYAQYNITLTIGNTYTVSGWVYAEESKYLCLSVQERASPWRAIGTDLVLIPAKQWTRLSVTVTLPSDWTQPSRIQLHPPRNSTTLSDFATIPAWWDAIQVEQKPYATSFIDGTRANPLKRITLPEPLPEEFGVGIAAKMLHAHDTADRTFWECGGYRCYFDAADNKIKLTNGVVIAETATVTWGANDYVGIYAGRDDTMGNLFVQAKIAGAVTERAGVAGDAIDSGTNLYVGSKADGSESVNAVVADFVLHTGKDINPEGFLHLH